MLGLDTASVDVTITDPPFDDEAHTQGRRINSAQYSGSEYGDGRQIVYRPLAFPPLDDAARALAACQIARVTKRWMVVFCQIESAHLWRKDLEDAGAEYIRTGIWRKPDGQPQYSGDRPGLGYETMVVCHGKRAKGDRLRWNGGGRSGVFEGYRYGEADDVPGWFEHTRDQHAKSLVVDERNGKRTERLARVAPHQTTKPLSLMLELVELFSDAGELVCDPFAGSASTGVAALQLKRGFLGWEISPEHHEMAQRRLRGDEARPNPRQPSLF